MKTLSFLLLLSSIAYNSFAQVTEEQQQAALNYIESTQDQLGQYSELQIDNNMIIINRELGEDEQKKQQQALLKRSTKLTANLLKSSDLEGVDSYYKKLKKYAEFSHQLLEHSITDYYTDKAVKKTNCTYCFKTLTLVEDYTNADIEVADGLYEELNKELDVFAAKYMIEMSHAASVEKNDKVDKLRKGMDYSSDLSLAVAYGLEKFNDLGKELQPLVQGKGNLKKIQRYAERNTMDLNDAQSYLKTLNLEKYSNRDAALEQEAKQVLSKVVLVNNEIIPEILDILSKREKGEQLSKDDVDLLNKNLGKMNEFGQQMNTFETKNYAYLNKLFKQYR